MSTNSSLYLPIQLYAAASASVKIAQGAGSQRFEPRGLDNAHH